MKKYTQKDFDKFEVVNGIVQCPTGDYSSISVFAEYCSFAKRCSFAEYCSFAKRCSFAEYCSFAEHCSFAKYCLFAEYCSFADHCSFAKLCSFAEYCSFAKYCSFDGLCSFAEDCSFAKLCSFAEYCSFAKRCSFAEYCSFAKRCSFAEDCLFAEGIKIEGYHKLIAYIGIDRIGSRLGKTYFFKCKDGLFVRCGCWFGTMEDFTARVKETHPTGRFRKEYDMAIDYATKWSKLK